MTASYYVNHFTDSIVFDNVTVPFTYLFICISDGYAYKQPLIPAEDNNKEISLCFSCFEKKYFLRFNVATASDRRRSVSEKIKILHSSFFIFHFYSYLCTINVMQYEKITLPNYGSAHARGMQFR